MPNRLADETSPYLLQHAHNPVDWYPWGEEALARARAEDKPLLLSVGYAACHWCHVMERESFEDERTARVMNELFVNVKVDREERPDVDAIYMQAVQAMTGHGGWPMTVFLTPDGAPFYGGTYFPPEDRHGMPSFRRVLLSVADAWMNRRDGVAKSADALRQMYDDAERATAPTGQLTEAVLRRAERSITARYDARHGGFEGAPKFPQAMAMEFLLLRWARAGERPLLDMALDTFRAMARGGIYDQVGGGFARYSVDAVWLVPHFEKMLYDNALLTRLGVHLWQATRAGADGAAAVTAGEVRRVVEETLGWLRREMTAPSGGFYSTLDADSEGHEGKFYVWDEAELDVLLGDDARALKRYWGVSAEGNFEGRNILHVHQGWPAPAAEEGADRELAAAVARGKRALYEARSRRVWPARDEKILASWNGLMLRAVAEAARAFEGDEYRAMAIGNAEFLASTLVDPATGRVTRVHKDGVSRVAGFLEDHASVALGFLAVYELTFDARWLRLARQVGDAAVDWFWDDGAGAFYDTARDHERLVTRPRDVFDNATPSGTSLAVELLLRLAELDADADRRRRAGAVLETLVEPMARYGQAFGHLLAAADLAVHGAVEVALVGEPGSEAFLRMAAEVGRRFVPALVVAGGAPGAGESIALLADRPAIGNEVTGYVCRHYTCEQPVTDPASLGAQLDRAGRVVGR